MTAYLSTVARERVTKFPEPTQQYGLSIVLRKKYPPVEPASEQKENRVEWSTIPSNLTELLHKRVEQDTLLASHVLQSSPVQRLELAGKCSTILEHFSGAGTTLIDVAPGATVTIREQREDNAADSSQLFLLNVGAGATVQWFGASLGSQGVTSRWAFATLAKDAVCTIHSALIHTPIVHEELHADLLAPGATFRARSLVVGVQDDQFDLHLSADHRAPSAVSNLRSKGVLGGKSQAVMRGNIRVRENAKGTDGYQRADGLLLSRGSEMDPVPNLEIETNDVRCTHGVAISHIHPEQRFYLQSRGLSQELADQLLISGFSSEIIGMYPEDMRSALEEACASALKAAV